MNACRDASKRSEMSKRPNLVKNQALNLSYFGFLFVAGDTGDIYDLVNHLRVWVFCWFIKVFVTLICQARHRPFWQGLTSNDKYVITYARSSTGQRHFFMSYFIPLVSLRHVLQWLWYDSTAIVICSRCNSLRAAIVMYSAHNFSKALPAHPSLPRPRKWSISRLRPLPLE